MTTSDQSQAAPTSPAPSPEPQNVRETPGEIARKRAVIELGVSDETFIGKIAAAIRRAIKEAWLVDGDKTDLDADRLASAAIAPIARSDAEQCKENSIKQLIDDLYGRDPKRERAFLHIDAAEAIERLQGENDWLRTALRAVQVARSDAEQGKGDFAKYAAEWLDRQAGFHEQNAASDEPDDKPVMTESDCSKAIAGYLRKAAHNLRARAADRSA
jgi:hypothetical protein